MTTERCSWCDGPLELDDGFRLAERPGERAAASCRLEHVVPWAIPARTGRPDGRLSHQE